MNSYTTVEAPVCGNRNSYSPSMMSFVGLQSNTQKQFWDWETNTSTSTSSSHPFIIPTTSFIDFSSTFAPTTLPPNYPQITHYPSMANGFLKREDGFFGIDGGSYVNNRIGLNLGHRTYFSSRETQVIDRLFKRSRGFYQANQIPRCQVEGCKVDLTNAKHYHRRHRVCEIHSKASNVVLAGGIEQRFCQQCSRFHALAEFDEEKRSCRKRLADHNRRRRKPRPGTISLDLGGGKTAPTAIRKFQEAEKMTRAGSSFPLLTTKDYKSNNQEEMKHFEQKVVVPQLHEAPALSLDGSRIVQRSCESQITYNHHPFSSPSYFARESISSSSCAINSHCCNINLLREASHSNSGRSDQTHQQQPEELHNLLQLGHAMFEVGLL